MRNPRRPYRAFLFFIPFYPGLSPWAVGPSPFQGAHKALHRHGADITHFDVWEEHGQAALVHGTPRKDGIGRAAHSDV